MTYVPENTYLNPTFVNNVVLLPSITNAFKVEVSKVLGSRYKTSKDLDLTEDDTIMLMSEISRLSTTLVDSLQVGVRSILIKGNPNSQRIAWLHIQSTIKDQSRDLVDGFLIRRDLKKRYPKYTKQVVGTSPMIDGFFFPGSNSAHPRHQVNLMAFQPPGTRNPEDGPQYGRLGDLGPMARMPERDLRKLIGSRGDTDPTIRWDYLEPHLQNTHEPL